MTWRIEQGDCTEQMRELDEASVDAIVTDPPYGLGFMGKEWDTAAAMASRPPSAENAVDGTAEARGAYPKGTGKGPQAVEFDHHAFQSWSQAWATEALRVLKPGGHLLAFGGTRTYHRLACAVEDAGFEIRDSLIWLYGSGFPKSLDVSKAIDRQRDDYEARCTVAEWLRPHVEAHGFAEVTTHFGFKDETMARARWTSRSQPNTPTLAQWAELKGLLGLPDDMDAEVWRLNGRKGQPGENWEKREKIGEKDSGLDSGSGVTVDFSGSTGRDENGLIPVTAPATPEAAQWQGWGTALKPAHEPIVVARKPLVGTVAANVLEHGTGALNVDGCRVGDNPGYSYPNGAGGNTFTVAGDPDGSRSEPVESAAGRWPPNVTLSHLPECERVGERRVKSAGFERNRPDRQTGDVYGEHKPSGFQGRADPDGTETIPAYSCAPGCPVAELDRQSGESRSPSEPVTQGGRKSVGGIMNATGEDRDGLGVGYGDAGGASRFFATFQKENAPNEEVPTHPHTAATDLHAHLPEPAAGIPTPSLADRQAVTRFRYTAKASRAERNAGLDGFEERAIHAQTEAKISTASNRRCAKCGRTKFSQPHCECPEPDWQETTGHRNNHPTVKPIDLMRWLVRLVTPPGGLVLDPFTGSGTTGIAAVLEGFDFIGLEREAEYVAIAEARIKFWSQYPGAEVGDVLVSDAKARAIEATGQGALL